MTSEKSNPIYFQVPKLMTDHPKITGDHIYIFMPLYDHLRRSPWDKIGYNKTNEFLHEFSKIGLRQVKTKLNQLEEWGFLIRKGMGHNRKFFIGKIFNNSAESEPVLNLDNRAGSELEQGEIGTSTGSKRNYIIKNVIKNINKKEIARAKSKTKTPTPEEHELMQNYKYGLEHPEFLLKPDLLEHAKKLYDKFNPKD